jgi:hypothetical protein
LLRWYTTVVDARDHRAEAAWWARVQRLVDLGAHRVDVGQGDAPEAVLADPEGNEFCVLTPRPQ